MKRRPGFTLLELVIVMSVFVLALAIIVIDFRGVDEREYLTQAATDIVALGLKAQSWSVANRPDPNIVTAGQPSAPEVGYSLLFQQGRFCPNETTSCAAAAGSPDPVACGGGICNYVPVKLVGVRQAAGAAQYLDVFLERLSVRPSISIEQIRIYQNDPGHCLCSPIPPLGVVYQPPKPTIALILNKNYQAASDAAVFIYLRDTKLNECRRVTFRLSGQIMQAKAACPAACGACIPPP